MKHSNRLVYQAIKEISQNQPGVISKLLRRIGVSRQAYYQAMKRQPNEWERNNELLKRLVKEKYEFHHRKIGATNLSHHINQEENLDFEVSRKQIQRVMRELGIRCQARIKKRHIKRQQEQYTLDNQLNQNFEVSQPNEVWLADSTELKYGSNGEKSVRLSGVLDLFGRRLIAYHLSPTETAQAEVTVFKAAFLKAGEVHPMIHTDRGSAYTSGIFNEYLTTKQVTRSMSRPGTPYDNAPMERWWSEFKIRWYDCHPRPKTLPELEQLVQAGVHYFEHHVRKTQRNGLTPIEYWDQAV